MKHVVKGIFMFFLFSLFSTFLVFYFNIPDSFGQLHTKTNKIYDSNWSFW